MTDYVDLVEYIVKNMVDQPDDVVVESREGRGRSETIEISLAAGDVGRVIGKGGRNIEAIRAVVKAASIREHHRVNVEIIADELPQDGGLGADDDEAPEEELPDTEVVEPEAVATEPAAELEETAVEAPAGHPDAVEEHVEGEPGE